ncbi:hemolytic protein HlpA [Spirosoma aerophilum]
MLETPVLLIMFNRSLQAMQVFERIRSVSPSKLYLAVDGPRSGNVSDIEETEKCRQIESLVDWPCTVQTLFRKENLGCRQAVSQAITWLFEHEEKGIILEDDCLPDLSFFGYCQVLLNRYVNEPKIMHVGGSNLYGDMRWNNDSFFFTNIPHIWGWATWRRAWKKYDITMSDYKIFEKSGGIERTIKNKNSQLFWKKSFGSLLKGEIDTWDYQWVFTIWNNNGLCIIPRENLITNIGFTQTATHTKENSVWANLQAVTIDAASMQYPEVIEINTVATQYAYSHFYQLPSWWHRKLKGIKRLVK